MSNYQTALCIVVLPWKKRNPFLLQGVGSEVTWDPRTKLCVRSFIDRLAVARKAGCVILDLKNSAWSR